MEGKTGITKQQRSVTKSQGIRCCAKMCLSGSDENENNFFFKFPKCDPNDPKSVERCAKWVKKAGNAELLKCKSSDLSEKFYLCCNHFADWSARNNTHRFIPADAVPLDFKCTPLSKRVMRFFPVTAENMYTSDSNTSDSNGAETQNANPELESTASEPSEDPLMVPEPTDKSPLNDVIKTEVDEALGNPIWKSFDASKIIPSGEFGQKTSLEEPNISSPVASSPLKPMTNGRPSRKAKLSAVSRICGSHSSPNPDKDEDEPVRKAVKSTAKWNLTAQKKAPPAETNFAENVDEPERLSARSSIVSHNILSKLGTPFELSTSPKRSKEGEQNQQMLSSRTIAIPELMETTDTQQIESNTVTVGPKEFENMHTSSDRSNGCYVLPLKRTTGTQTNLEGVNQNREIIRILDTDRKLKIFCGMPSFDTLDSLTDSTLKMVMNNQAMISDIEPTMREWIILTCTKFKLGLPLEALSVMFEVPEEECRKIVEKTCLFLRKTLSLPDCQRFVWDLPAEVLTGIADMSDEIIRNS